LSTFLRVSLCCWLRWDSTGSCPMSCPAALPRLVYVWLWVRGQERYSCSSSEKQHGWSRWGSWLASARLSDPPVDFSHGVQYRNGRSAYDFAVCLDSSRRIGLSLLPARSPCLPHRSDDCNSYRVIQFNRPIANRDLKPARNMLGFLAGDSYGSRTARNPTIRCP